MIGPSVGIKLLVQAGANVNEKTKRGGTLLHMIFGHYKFVRWYPGLQSIARMLWGAKGFNRDAMNKNGETISELAKQLELVDKFKFSNIFLVD